MAELGLVGIGHVPVIGSVLGLQQRQEAATDEELAISRRAQVVRRIATGGDIADVDNLAKSILRECILAHGSLAKGWGESVGRWKRRRLTSSSEVVTRKSLCLLSPAPVQK